MARVSQLSGEPLRSIGSPLLARVVPPRPRGGRLRHATVMELPRVTDPRGNLTSVEGGKQVPFDIKRVYYLYDVPGGETRGGHAHRELERLTKERVGHVNRIKGLLALHGVRDCAFR